MINRLQNIENKMQKRSSFQIQLAVIHALMVRELKTRFGRYRLGVAWALIDPLIQILVFMLMFHFRGMAGVGGLALPLFLATGIAPFSFFTKIINQCTSAAGANKNLLIYRQVRVFDLFLTRFILELGIAFVVLMSIFLGIWWLGFEIYFVNTIKFITVFALINILAFGVGLIFGVTNTLYPEAGKFLPVLLRPLMFISGTFFSINDIPVAAQEYLLWNPLVHAFELMRSCFSQYYSTSLVSLSYLSLCALFTMTVGMIMFRANWRKMLTI